MPRYNVGDILTFKSCMAIDRRTKLPTKRWREVVVTKSGNFIAKIGIYPPLMDDGPYRTIVKLPKKLRIKKHTKA